MRRNPMRTVLVFCLLALLFVFAAARGGRSITHLMAAESAELSSYMPAIFARAGGTNPPATATPNVTSTPTRPPKATETPKPTVVGTATTIPTVSPTPLATNTPNSLPTTTPRFTPQPPTTTPSPTPQTGQVIVLPNDSSYVDKGHDLHIIGEVKNTGTTTVQYVNIKATLYTHSGVELEDASTYAAMKIIPAGDKACFEFVLPEPQAYGYYVFTDVNNLPPTYPLPTLVVSNVQAGYNPSHGFYEMAGKITNNGTEVMLNVRAVGTLYDGSGVVRGCQNVPVGLDGEIHDVLAGDHVPFQIAFTGRDNSDVTSYRIQADGTYFDEEEGK